MSHTVTPRTMLIGTGISISDTFGVSAGTLVCAMISALDLTSHPDSVIASITYDGVAMSPGKAQDEGTNSRAWVYYLHVADAVASASLTVTFTAAVQRTSIKVITVTGHDSASPLGATAGTHLDNDTSPQLGITTTRPDSLVLVACLGRNYDQRTLTPDSGWSIDSLDNGTVQKHVASWRVVGAAGSWTAGWTIESSDGNEDSVIAMIEIKKAIKTTIWTGDVDGNVSDAANWSNGVPENGDTAIAADSDVSMDENLNQSAITLVSLFITRTYTGSIGSEASPLRIGAATVIINQRSGSTHLKGDYTTVYVRGTSAEDPAVSLTHESTIINAVRVLGSSGKVKIIDSSNLGTLMVNPARGGSAHVHLGADVDNVLSSFISTLRCYGGSIFAESGANDVRVFASRLQFDGEVWNDDVLLVSGSIHGRAGDKSGGKFVDGTLRVLGGLFTLASNREDLITIDDLTMLGAATVDLRTGLRAATLTNGIAYRGGRLRVDRGVTINAS